MLSTVSKVGKVLELFTPERQEWGVSEVAGTLDFPKSSAHELLATMSCIGLLRRGPHGRYRLGWRILEFGHVLLSSTEFESEARTEMERLVARFGETVHLAVLEDNQVIYVGKLQGTHAVQVTLTHIGSAWGAHCSAVGKVLLAFQSREQVVSMVSRHGLPQVTPRTITDLDSLQDELRKVAQQGYAYDIEESCIDLCCVAAPIRDYCGKVAAAMSISVPSYRFHSNQVEYQLAIVDASHSISRSLGYAMRSRSPEIGVRQARSGKWTTT